MRRYKPDSTWQPRKEDVKGMEDYLPAMGLCYNLKEDLNGMTMIGYLPSLGQMKFICDNLDLINELMDAFKIKHLSMEDDMTGTSWFWTSTSIFFGLAWMISTRGIENAMKTTKRLIFPLFAKKERFYDALVSVDTTVKEDDYKEVTIERFKDDTQPIYNALMTSNKSIDCVIDGINIDPKTIYIDNFDEQERIDEGDIVWYADVMPCTLDHITIDGKRINGNFEIEHGEVRGVFNIKDVNRMFKTRYNSIDKIPESKRIEFITNDVKGGVRFNFSGDAGNIFE